MLLLVSSQTVMAILGKMVCTQRIWHVDVPRGEITGA